jgi:alpha-tubulin suppressor-like RCC1 family protein
VWYPSKPAVVDSSRFETTRPLRNVPIRAARGARLSTFRSVVATLFAACASATTGCRAERTQIVVVVDTDFAVPSTVGSLRIRVADPRGGEPIVQPLNLLGSTREGCTDTPNSARFCVPLSFLVVPGRERPADAAVEVQVEAVAGADALSGRTIVARAARLSFVMGQTLRLPLFISRACEGVRCPSDQTCAEGGACVPIDRPPGVVPIDPRSGQPLLDAGEIDATPTLDAASDTSDDVANDHVFDVIEEDVSTLDAQVPLCGPAGCPPIASLRAAKDYTCALYASGRVACWGANDFAQLGRRTITARATDGTGGEPTPVLVTSLTNVSTLGTGDEHACAVRSAGATRELVCWGNNPAGSLGGSSMTSPLSEPTVVAMFTQPSLPTMLALGRSASFALSAQNILAWGMNEDHALGVAGDPPPSVVTRLTAIAMNQRVRSLSARARGACWVENPETYCVEENAGQRFGAIAAPGAIVTAPRVLDASYRVDSITLGPSFACAVVRNAVACWGANLASGVLGRPPVMGEPEFIPLPRTIELGAEQAARVEVGDESVLVLTASGNVYCWGSNVEGLCATGVLSGTRIAPSSVTPTRIAFASQFTAPARHLAVGAAHACVVDAANVVWCWGRNRNGQAGQPLSRPIVLAPSPVQLP